MSETQEDPVAEDPVVPAADPVEPEAEQQTEQAADDTEAEQVATEEQPEDAKPKPQRDRRFANLRARTTSLEAELAEERTKRAAAEALLNANNQDDAPPARSTETVEQAAERLLAQRHLNDRLTEIDTAGRAIEGWDEAKATMTSLGAVNNAAFLEALSVTPEAEKVFAELAEDTDLLTALLKKTPVAMAAEMGRMAAKIETRTKTTAAPGRPLSAAPRPVTPVHAPAVTPTFDPYKKGVTLEEFIAHRKKTAPARLGGQR